MPHLRIYRSLFVCALVATPLFASGCGDDDGDDDDDTADASSDAGDSGVRDGGGDAARDGAPDLDGTIPGADASRMDSSTDSATIDGTVPSDATTPGDATTDGAVADATIDGAVSSAGDTWGITSAKRLVLFSRANGSIERAVTITGIPDGETIVGADVRPADSSVVALTSAGKLFTVNPQTGAAALRFALSADTTDTSAPFTALSGSAYAVDFNPVVDRLRVISNTGQNLRINVDTGTVITDTTIRPDSPGLVAAAYSNSFAAACRTQLYAIDATARRLLVLNSPNNGVVTDVGSLGDTAIGQITSFEIAVASDGTNTALVSATATGGERVSQVNLTTGAVSGPQTVPLNSGERFDAIFTLPPSAAPAQPQGELLAVTNANKLISINRSAPSKTCSSVAITGLASGENVLGADIRPADGQLYAISSANKLYTIAVATGVATQKATLAADPADTSSPFSALTGADWGIGFNPAADRLRLHGPSGANLRVNPDNGQVTTDSTLSGTPAIAALAYTNGFAGARTTTLYAIDAASNDLVTVGANPATADACPNDTNPNCGVIDSIGDLGLTGDVTAVGGLDIDSTSGAAVAAVTVGDATTSTLYTINLATGVAALPAGVTNGTIGGGERVVSLSFVANPSVTAYAVTSENRLLAFSPSTPGTITRNVQITGLQASENIVGVDVRAADKRLFALGSSSRLYTVDTTSGAASLVAALVNENGTAFALPAGTYGVDFDPDDDVLRLVNGDQQNFTVAPAAATNVDPGEVDGDTAIAPTGGAPGLTSNVRAAAYTNNFAEATSTTLFVLNGSQLYRQGGVGGTPSASTGQLTPIGAGHGVTVSGDIGFDIVGGHNGLALAAISNDGQATSLYSVNLTSGVATAYNASANVIGQTGNLPLRGFALELK